MRFRRVAAATVVAAVAGGGALLASTAMSSAATTPPTQINLGLANSLLGMSSPACPLPLNTSIGVAPGTAIQFEPDPALAVGIVESVTISPDPTNPKSKTALQISNLTSTTKPVTFPAGSYKIGWKSSALFGILSLSQSGTIDATNTPGKQQCLIGIHLPTPSASVPIVPSAVNGIVNGVVGSVVGGVNSAVAPVNSAVGPVLGGVNGGLGGLTGGGTSSGASGSGSKPSAGPSISTIYTPSDETGAQRTVPQGGGAGGGANAGVDGQSINAADIPFKGVGSAVGTNQSVKSGGSPKTVELAANKPRSALDGWANLIVLAAVLALSGATAFYARTYLLHPLPAKVKAGS